MDNEKIKNLVIKLRGKGKTYAEILNVLNAKIPKSTLAYWCKDVQLPDFYSDKVKTLNLSNINKVRKLALIANKNKQQEKINNISKTNEHLPAMLKNKDIAKIVLATLYLCEGTKNQKRGSLTIGNSDPLIINLFLQLLRFCYRIDEGRFRCTLQCRADQDIKKLESFWSKVTKIPLDQFYQARVDARTINKISKNKDYKGVCRIDYFSADIFWQLTKIGELICLNR
ncbi:MAG: hypothetical protein WCP18_02350 [bacterium]